MVEEPIYYKNGMGWLQKACCIWEYGILVFDKINIMEYDEHFFKCILGK